MEQWKLEDRGGGVIQISIELDFYGQYMKKTLGVNSKTINVNVTRTVLFKYR